MVKWKLAKRFERSHEQDTVLYTKVPFYLYTEVNEHECQIMQWREYSIRILCVSNT